MRSLALRCGLLALAATAAPLAAQPNLTVAFVPSDTDTAGEVGESFEVRVTVCNSVLSGGEVDDPEVTYALSDDGAYDAGDLFVGADTAQDLDPGECDDEGESLTVPFGVAAGAYQLLAVVDAQGAVAETDESDNTAAVAFTVTGGGPPGRGPDAQMRSYGQRLLLRRGGAYTFEWDARNVGDQEALVAPALYLSSDTALSGDDAFVGAADAETLSPGDSEEFEFEDARVPVRPYGDYFLLATPNAPGDADPTNDVGSRPVRLTLIQGETTRDLDFGTVEIGSSRTLDVTMGNSAASLDTLDVRTIIYDFTDQFTTPVDGDDWSLAPGEAVTFPVTFTARWPGEWRESVAYFDNATDGGLRTWLTAVAVHGGDAASAPSPEAFDLVVAPGAAATEALTIANPGSTPLDFELFGSDDDYPTPRSGSGGKRSGRGGPDAFGHLWRDSDEPDGPAFEWVEIRETGTPRLGFYSAVALPWPFPFYGAEHTTLYLHHHGHISFGGNTSSVACSGYCGVPDGSPPDNVLMPYYMSFFSPNPSTVQGEIHTQDMGDGRFVVQFTEMYDDAFSGDRKTFQAVLHADGRVLFNYLDVTDQPGDGRFDHRPARIGMEAVDAADHLRIADSQDYRQVARDSVAIEISRTLPIVRGFEPQSGTVPPGGAVDVAVTFQAVGLPAGQAFADSVLVRSNAVEGHERWLPVRLAVGGATPSEGPAVPARLALSPPAPNPARGAVRLTYALPRAARVRLDVHDALGRRVVRTGGRRAAGTHTASVPLSGLPPGLYLVRLVADGETRTRRLTVAR